MRAYFAVIQDDTVWGIGRTENEAWADAREWAEGEVDGDCIECTEEFFRLVERVGGCGLTWRIDTDGRLTTMKGA